MARTLLLLGLTLSLSSLVAACDGTMTGTLPDAGRPSGDGGVGSLEDAARLDDAGSDDAGLRADAGPSAVEMPTEENTGPAPGTTFTDLQFSDLRADTTYTGVRLLGIDPSADWPPGVRLVDSLVYGSIGGTVCFHFERVRMEGGIYVRMQPGQRCDGTIRDSAIISGGFAIPLRPACTDPAGNQNTSAERCTSGWTVEDSFLSQPMPGDPAAGHHLEALMGLWDVGGFTFRNVNFFLAGPPNGTQTGDINWDGSNSTFTDCWFTGDAGYRVYATGRENVVFVRPRIALGAGSFGPWYPPMFPTEQPSVLRVECPMMLDGTPITTIPGSVCP